MNYEFNSNFKGASKPLKLYFPFQLFLAVVSDFNKGNSRKKWTLANCLVKYLSHRVGCGKSKSFFLQADYNITND